MIAYRSAALHPLAMSVPSLALRRALIALTALAMVVQQLPALPALPEQALNVLRPATAATAAGAIAEPRPATGSIAASAPQQARIGARIAELPLAFEANRGQGDPAFDFMARGLGYTFGLEASRIVLALQPPAPARAGAADVLDGRMHARSSTARVVTLELVGAQPGARAVPADALPGTVNYYLGNDPARWIEDVPSYARVRYEGVYPGIDVVHYGNGRQLEFDVVVAAGADPTQFGLRVHGSERLRLRGSELVLTVADGELVLRAPDVYQEIDGARVPVPARYVLEGEDRVAIRVDRYDGTRPLVIDPVIVYSTYLGGSGSDIAEAIAIDGSGNAYVTGTTTSTSFPTLNAAQSVFGGGTFDAFAAKLNAAGTSFAYKTYLGGTGIEFGFGVATEASGNGYYTGFTESGNFPTASGFDTTLGGTRDAYIVKLSAAGTLSFSSFLGGNSLDNGNAVAVDTAGAIYLTGFTGFPPTGESNTFPTTSGAFDITASGDSDAWVAKLSPTGGTPAYGISYSTFLGGSSSNEGGAAITVDGNGIAHVVGNTTSTDFPTVNAFQAAYAGGPGLDMTYTALNSTGTGLLYSTYIGGTGDDRPNGANAIAPVVTIGGVWIVGSTQSATFPTKNPLQGAFAGATDAVVFKIRPDLSGASSLIYSTYLGGKGQDSGYGIGVDAVRNMYVIGTTSLLGTQTAPNDFPTTLDTLKTCDGTGFTDLFVSKIKADGSGLAYSTCIGGGGNDLGFGIAVDGAGNAYITGRSGGGFPTTAGAAQTTHAGSDDAVIAKLAAGPRTFVVTNTNDSGPGSLRQAILDANANIARDTISFNVEGPAPHTISPASALPMVTDPVSINGLTQPDATAGSPTIVLDGTNAGQVDGLLIAAGDSTVRGLVIGRFSGEGFTRGGIRLITNGGNVVAGNFSGTDATGTLAAPNQNGIVIESSNNTIGGLTAADRNLISGNLFGGVAVLQAASGNQIWGNYIGTDVYGTADLGNHTGVEFHGSDNTVGGTTAAHRNVISGNVGGVRATGLGSGNKVQGNYIGTDAAGATAVGNLVGVVADKNTLVGGSTAGAGNVISGNDRGVELTLTIVGQPAGGSNAVQGNHIGLNAAGTAALANNRAGIAIIDSPNNRVGGTTAGAGNVISGNTDDGIHIQGSTGTLVQGNLIGLDANGSLAVGNGSAGIRLTGAGGQVGGTSVAARNVISGNLLGVSLSNGGSNWGAVIQGNYIGTDITGSLARWNGVGVTIQSAPGTRVGGPAPGAGNLISGNGIGIHVNQITHPAIDGIYTAVIQGNVVGLNAAGTGALGNSTGISISSVTGDGPTLIGGLGAGEGNVVSGNAQEGIQIAGARGNVVRGNLIGTSATGTAVIGNLGRGIHVANAVGPPATLIGSNVLVGNGNGLELFNVSEASVVGNVISGNSCWGAYLGSTSTVGLNSNKIGVLADGTTPSGNGCGGVILIYNGGVTPSQNNALVTNVIARNGGSGVQITNGSSSNVLFDNTIRENGVDGVQVTGETTTGNQIGAGSITGHSGKAIKLTSFANGGISPPAITDVLIGGASGLTVSGTAGPSALVSIYVDPNDEAETFLGEVFAGADGQWTKGSGWTLADLSAITTSLKVGSLKLRATQRDAAGNTSELSGAAVVGLSIAGTASCNGTVLPLARVQLRSGQRVLAETVATATGDFLFSDVEPGLYELVFISADGATVCGAGATVSESSGTTTQPTPTCTSGANPTWTTATPMDGPITGSICRLGTSAWYKFTAPPESILRLRLTGPSAGPLSPDLNLFLYRDILAEATKTVATKDDWTAAFAGSEFIGSEFIGSEFIGSEFIGSEFIGSEFIGSEFIGSEFIGSEFIGSEFIGSEFIGSEFIGSEFIGSEFIGSEFIGSEFIGSEFIGSEFIGFNTFGKTLGLGGLDPKAFSAAVANSLIRFSINKGSQPESISHYTWERGGTYYAQVRGRDGAFSLDDTYALGLEVIPSACSGIDTSAGTSSLTPPAGPFPTLILTNSARFPAAEVPVLTAALSALATATGGYVADLAGDAALGAAYAQWDANSLCSLAANEVADGIKAFVDAFRAAHPELERIVFAGSDRVLAFRRVEDPAKLAPEWWHVPPVKGTTNTGLRTNKILTDDFYTAAHPIVKGNYTIFVPTLATGRLVESAAEIANMVNAYLETDGLVSLQSGVVTGYSFLDDLAEDLKAQLEAMGVVVNSTPTTHPLIQNEPGLPGDPNAWTSQDLGTAIGGDPDILWLNVHHTTPGTFLAADYSKFTSNDLLALAQAQPGLLRNSLVFMTSCHSVFNVPDGDNIGDSANAVTRRPDSAQAFARLGATAIGGTGYQYGETIDGVKAYTERLHLNLLRVLREGTDPVELGAALVEAKRRYVGAITEMEDVHAKVPMVATLYGVPGMRVDLGATNRLSAPTDLASFTYGDLQPVGRYPGLHPSLDLRTFDLGLDLTSAAHQTQPKSVTLNVLSGAGTTTATYFAVVTPDSGPDGLTVANPGEPILPSLVVPVRVESPTGTFIRGAVFLGGSFATVANATPVTGTPGYQLAEAVRHFFTPDPFPASIQRLNYVNGDHLIVTPAQYESATAATGALETFGTWRRYTSTSFRLYYSPVLTATVNTAQGTFQAALAAPPSLLSHTAEVDGDVVRFEAFVSVEPHVGVQDVFVTWTAEGAGSFSSIQLAQDPTNGLRWSASLTLPAGVSASDVRYMLQTVSGVGVVSRWTNLGALYTPLAEPATIAPIVTTALQLQSFTTPIVALRGVDVTARLVDEDGAGVPGKALTFALGGERVTRFTDAAGVATARLQAMARPGAQPLAVSFAEEATHLGTSVTQEVTVQKETTSLTLTLTTTPVSSPASQQYSDLITVEATLSDGLGRRLREQTVFFQIRDATGAVRQVAAEEADFNGVARTTIPLRVPVDVPVDAYTVTAAYAGVVQLVGSTADLTSPRYHGAVSPQVALTVTPEDATATYTGDAVKASTQTVVLTGTIAEVADGTPGDLATATATFELFNETTGTRAPSVSGTITLGPNGTATVSATIGAGQLPAGVYRVRLVVGGSYTGQSEDVFVVIYDPAAGSVTAGGWIVADAATRVGFGEGRITFGLTWKYKDGTTTPRGSLQLKQGTTGFHAGAAEWLVIAGATAEVEGTGSLNGTPGYRWRARITDEPDGLQIRIWDASSSYQSPLFRAERTPLDNGSSKIH